MASVRVSDGVQFLCLKGEDLEEIIKIGKRQLLEEGITTEPNVLFADPAFLAKKRIQSGADYQGIKIYPSLDCAGGFFLIGIMQEAK